MNCRNIPTFRRIIALVCLISSCFVLFACGARQNDHGHTPSGSQSVTTPASEGATSPGNGDDVSVRPLQHKSSADLLIRSKDGISEALQRRVEKVEGVGTTLAFAAGTTTLDGSKVHVAAVDPSTYRAFAPTGTAESDPLWASVARGELAVMHTRAKKLALKLGGQAKLDDESRRVGAFATTLPGVDVVVDRHVGETLHLQERTGMVVSVDEGDPGVVGQRVTKLVDEHADVDLLTAPDALPREFVTGEAAAKAFGTFSYKYSADGTITPDPAWVKANIRTETVPLIGEVTCHRLMIPQLRGALTEIKQAGLSGAIHPSEYGGCYVPRFIERNPNRPISLHTWGIAVDLNVPGNQRGTKGEMNPQVVAIFKKWGFAWGGDWSYTDPMHFELHALLKKRPN